MECALLNEQNDLTDLFKAFLRDVFLIFSNEEEEYMPPENIATFILVCTDSDVQFEDERIKSFLSNFCCDIDKGCTLQEFTSFYLKSSLTKADTVNDNINQLMVTFFLKIY